MLSHDLEIDGYGSGYYLSEAQTPEWLGISDTTELWSFMVWLRRVGDAGTNRFRTVFSTKTLASNNNGIHLRVSSTSANLIVRSNSSSTTLGNIGLTPQTAGWTLIGGFIDPTGVNVEAEYFGAWGDSPDAASNHATGTGAATAALPTITESLQVARGWNVFGSRAWLGNIGPITFWKGVQLAPADVTYAFAQRAWFPHKLAANGNLPGPAHDGIMVLGHCPLGNGRSRGGSNVEGNLIGDDITEAKDVHVYRQETGVTDSGEWYTFEDGTTVDTTDATYTLRHPLREE